MTDEHPPPNSVLSVHRILCDPRDVEDGLAVAGDAGVTAGQAGVVWERQAFCETIQVEPSVSLPMDPMVWTLINVMIESCFYLELFSSNQALETKLLYHEYLG